ncbi:hypothetical protein SAMN05216275_14148 [Streptosporangium canum]|uniref:Uncharacterized protein n=1 Tax=Streptosporangium canum TaxID=324952 RepID=A0A1I4DEZ2_9ACTN|nr:hypothetical protein [Streptosporangium canum]SFK92324.1 hypothetical protein SAMN05216275_14148 [Streptosporangium canum]
MAEIRAWWAPSDTPPNSPDWRPLGYLTDDGLQILDDLPHEHVPFNWPSFTLTLTRCTGHWPWSAWRLLTGTTHPAARRAKTTYHRRRR